MPTTNGMDTAGARELAKRIAEEERRRTEGGEETRDGEDAAGSEHVDASRDPDLEGVVVAVERLRGEAESLKVELAARDDAIARLRMELGELRGKMAADDSLTSERSRNDAPTDHLLFVSQPSS